MSDEEFDLMDELYFVQSYDYLKETLGWEDEVLIKTLVSLYDQGYIKCLSNPDSELFTEVNVEEQAKKLHFLATKNGLMAHNTI